MRLAEIELGTAYAVKDGWQDPFEVVAVHIGRWQRPWGSRTFKLVHHGNRLLGAARRPTVGELRTGVCDRDEWVPCVFRAQAVLCTWEEERARLGAKAERDAKRKETKARNATRLLAVRERLGALGVPGHVLSRGGDGTVVADLHTLEALLDLAEQACGTGSP